MQAGHDESHPGHLQREEIAVFLAVEKSKVLSGSLKDNSLLITADTIVWLNEKVINKPEDREDAIRMLQELSGNKHTVATGVCLRTKHKVHSFYSLTDVYLRPLQEEEILYYIDQFEPYDKAGGYGIQEWIGYAAVQKIEGSFYNVMGLPVEKLYVELMDFLVS
jgi:septum formation protein